MYVWCQKKFPDIEVAYADKVPFPELESTLNDWATRGYNFIHVGSAWVDAVKIVAPNYPKVKFGVTDGDLKGPNIQTVDWRSEQCGYLSGLVGGMMTKSNVLAWVAAAEYPDVVRVGEAFKIGAKSVNPKVKILDNYIGTWEDQALAYEAASAMADGGADIFIHIADQAALGITKLVKDRKLWNIGEHLDQRSLAPDNTLSSFLHAFEEVFERNLEDARSGNFGNKIVNWGAKEGWPLMKYEKDVLPLKVVETVQKTYIDIACGKIEVPYITKPTKA
jgi:basic membrane protein A